MDYLINTRGKNSSIAVQGIIKDISNIKHLLYIIDIDLDTIFLLIKNKQFYHTYKEKGDYVGVCSTPNYNVADLYIDDFMYMNIVKYIAVVEELNDLFYEFTGEEEKYKFTTEYIFERPFYVLRLVTLLAKEGKIRQFLNGIYKTLIPVDLVIKNCITSELGVNTRTGLRYHITNEIDNSFIYFAYLQGGIDNKDYVAIGLEGVKNSHVLCSLGGNASSIDSISKVVNSAIHLQNTEDLLEKQDTVPYHILETILSGLSITTPENDVVYVYGSNYSEAFNEKHLFRGTAEICISQEAYESNLDIMDLQGALVPGGFLISRVRVCPTEKIQALMRNATSIQNPHLKICSSCALSDLSLIASKLTCFGQAIDLSLETKADSLFNYNYFFVTHLNSELKEEAIDSPEIKNFYNHLLGMMKIDEEQCFIQLRTPYPMTLLSKPDNFGKIYVEGVKALLYNFKK